MAFQRMMLLMRRSISRSPGYSGWSSTGMVLIYGVVALEAKGTPMRKARSRSFSSRNCARSRPCGLADEVERFQPFRRFLGIAVLLQDGHDAREESFFVSVWFHKGGVPSNELCLLYGEAAGASKGRVGVAEMKEYCARGAVFQFGAIHCRFVLPRQRL